MREKIVIDDAMVMRVLNAMDGTENTAFYGEQRKAEVRSGLEAALNPPPENETKATPAMHDAGCAAYVRHHPFPYNISTSLDLNRISEVVMEIYRAMERERRHAESDATIIPGDISYGKQQHESPYIHKRANEMPVRSGNIITYAHRRKDDPK